MTGTDTGVGKTWVSCRLLEAWRADGLRVAGLKAAESGVSSGQGEDDRGLFEAAGGWQPERCAFNFVPAVAPGVAADDEMVEIDFEQIGKQVLRLEDEADRVLVEGAGGWLVPMGRGRTIETLARYLGRDVLIVGRAGLGTINHASLTHRAVIGSGLRVAGIVLSVRPDDDLDFARRNAEEIGKITAAEVHLLRSQDDDGARAIAEAVGMALGAGG